MSDLSWPVQQMVYATLTADAGVKALVGTPARVYDNPPANPTFPYVTIGDDTARESGAQTFDGQEITLTIHAWSRYGGRKEAKQIAAAVYAALHDQSPSLTGGTLVNLRYEFGTTMQDPDGLTWHAASRFRASVCD